MDSQSFQYLSYEITSTLVKNLEREVHIIESINEDQSKSSYILKKVTSYKIPLEIILHNELSRKNSNILKVQRFWTEGQNHYIIMEFCEKGDLGNYIESLNQHPDPFNKIIEMCIKISENLKILHDFNVCHRDLKPQNIFITSQDNLKIGDFGYCKVSDINDTNEYHTLLGTKNYLSPELIRMYSGEYVQSNAFRDDIFALGKIFFDLGFGKIDNQMNINYPDNLRDYISIQLYNFSYPEGFIQLIQAMMCEDLNNFWNIEQVLEVLKRLSACNTEKCVAKTHLNSEMSTNLLGYEFIENKNIIDSNEHACDTRPRNIHLKVSLKNEYIEIAPPNICTKCETSIREEFVMLECNHFYHISCFLEEYQKKFENLRHKSDSIKCCRCESMINIHKFTDFEHFGPCAKRKINLLYWANTLFVCETCNLEIQKYHLNDNLNYYDLKCPKCKKKYCSFCGKKGSHYLKCSMLEGPKNIKE